MEEFLIPSFKYGLDTRRDVLTSQVGTLFRCENAHINTGGEVEKRKAFVQFADVGILDTDGFQGTFGLEVTEDGLVVFGSAIPFGGTPSNNQALLQSAMPANVSYQQLKHPTILNDLTEDYVPAHHRLTRVVFSENFNGKAFVAAQFSDGRYYCYYDGELVQQTANGIVMTGRTFPIDLSRDLVRQMEAVGWRGTANQDENGATQLGSTLVDSPQGDYFTPLPEDDSDTGVIGAKSISQDGATIPGTKPVASFKVIVNSGTFVVRAPIDDAGTTYAAITGSFVGAAGSAVLTAAAIAQAINDLTFVYGYSALATNDDVYVYAPIEFGPTFVFNLLVDTTTGSVGASGVAPTALSATLDPNPVDVTFKKPTGGIPLPGPTPVAGGCAASVSGGTGPYTYLWEETSPGAGNGIIITNEDKAITLFKYFFSNYGTRSGSFKCTIGDSGGATPIVLFLTVKLTYSR